MWYDMHHPILVTFIPRFFLMVVAIKATNPDYSTAYATACDDLKCKTNEQCLIRKFWCDYTGCPQMIYCSKSRLESLRGPETCNSVLCPSGYKCVLRVRECIRNYGCKQRLARCISEVELADEPATCANFECGEGYHCILRESHYCLSPPCRLTKSCADSEDVKIWFDKCRQLGCRSEDECFLRKPPEKCAISPCSYIPDCLVTPDPFESISNKLCHGWICPADEVCSARLQASCSSPGVNCPILRSCRRPLLDITQRADVRTVLSDIERDIFLEEQRRLQQYRKPLNFTQTKIQQFHDVDLPRTGQSWKNSENAAKSERVSMSPIMRSISQNGGGDSIWLTYLKHRAGAESVQYWIDKAKSNQDYEGFTEWLNTVQQLLDPDTYRLWLMEVQSASANVPEFQAWISSHNLATYRQAATSATQRTPPISIADRVTNLFYSDKSLGFADHWQGAESGSAIRQSSNFKFNEASQLGNGPLSHLEIPFRPQELSDVAYELRQDFGEAVKNSWKSWQSYYQLKPTELFEFAGKIDDSTHLDTKPHKNASVPQMFLMDSQYAKTLKRNDDKAARNFEKNIERIGGYKKIQPNVANLYSNQSTSQIMLSSTPKDDEQLPNLFIYFPPPLNFFIYYSVGSRNDNGNKILQTSDNDTSKSEVGVRKFNSSSYIPEDYDDNFNFNNKTSSIGKQKEFEFIRKIIRELINYWDDEEQSFGKLDKFNDDGDIGVRMAGFNGKPVGFTSTVTDEMKSEKPEGKLTFNKFLEWLLKNGHINLTESSNFSSRGKIPLVTEKSVNSPKSLNSENNKNTTSGKIHVIVDVDKNAEIIKKLFSKNITSNQNEPDSRQYQVIVNLNDYVEPQEEDLISQKLINIASKQLRRNITRDEKMPKVLWVFPVYGNEENETIINEIKKRSKEKVNTLEDVDIPTIHTDNNGGAHYMPENPNKNSEYGNVDKVKSTDNHASNIDSSNKDTENEYYDEQDAYDEDNDEQSDLHGSIET